MTTKTEPKPSMRAASILGKIIEAWYAGKRRLWIEGGTYASKTYSIMQFLKMLAENNPEPLHITVISETIPHLKQGAMLDFQNIMGEDFNLKNWNKTDYIYRWNNGSWMQFLSADNPSKAAGPRRDILFANEVNHIVKETFRQADMRTHLFTIADWNPESEFWFHDEELDDKKNLLNKDDSYIHTTYLDALEVLPEGKRKEIEKWELKDPNWWRVYGLGLAGKVENRVYPHFEQVDELPKGDYFYGLDFGYAQDPTVLVKNVIIGDNLYSEQVFYKEEPMTNDDISREMDLLGVSRSDPIYPDPNEPKSAEELRLKGWNIGETEKGKGSKEYGIRKVLAYYQHWTKDSIKCIKEQRNYCYIKRLEQGREVITSDTTHQWSHGMDARRYAVASYKENTKHYATIQDMRPSHQRESRLSEQFQNFRGR